MNNIYVEIKEKCCSQCYAECDGCWLEELITDRLAEERKKVVQEIKSWCDKNFNWVGDGTGYDGQEYNEMIGSNNTINKLRELLDQVERGE